MRLESIELKGFKSFANKTKIKFDNQITAVVGPNGSGKSNISDAVRWVLGEQSVKSLRGDKMKDVIFVGADGAKSQNIAEVSLNFLNEDRRLDIDYERVTITRRIYRSGENEYKINNKRARLKDIRELFFDTGVGKEGYSIIGQGRIDEIILSSPKDRRSIFEEASGISKHKYRRDEASKKLDTVVSDLEIIEKELSYKLKDFKLLKTYRDNYLRHKDLSKEINKKSYFYYKIKSTDLKKDRDELEEDIKKLKKAFSEASSKLDQVKTSLEPFNKEREFLKNQLEEIKNKQKACEKLIDKSKNDLNLNEQKLSYDRKDYKRIEELLEDLKNNLRQNLDKLSKKNKELEYLKEDYRKARKDQSMLRDETINTKSNLDDKNKEFISLKNDYDSLKEKILDYEIYKKSKEIIDEKAKKELEDRLSKLKSLEEEIKILKVKNKNLKSEYEKSLKIKDENDEEISSCEKSINKLIDYQETKVKSLNNLNLDLREALSDLKIEKNSLDNNQGYFYSVQDFLKKSKASSLDKYYLGPLANLISVKSGYEEVIENLIGSGLQNIVTRTKDETKNLIDFINKNRLGRITFLPIDSIRSYKKQKPKEPEVIAMAYNLIDCDESLDPIIGHFLGSTVVVKDIKDAISLSKKIKSYRIISLNLDIINSWGSMVAGSNKNKRSNINLLNRKKRFKDLGRKILSLKDKKQGYEEEINLSKEKLKSSRENYQKLKETALDISEKLQYIKQDLSKTSLNLESLEEKKTDLNKPNDTYNSGEISVDINKLLAKEKDLKQSLDKKEKDILSLKNLIEDGERKDLKLTNKIEVLERDRSILENSLAKLKNSLDDIKSNQKIQQKLILKLKDGINLANKKDEKLREKIKTNEQESKTLANEISKKEEELKKKDKSNQDLIEKSKKLGEEISNLDLLIVKKNYRLDSVRESLTNLVDEIKPFMSISLEDMEKNYSDEKLTSVKKKDLVSLQRSINDLGFFTQTSLEDYDQIKKEVDFIKEQIRDLKNSKRDIEKMIRRLEKEMKDEFSTNFDLINKNFSKIFKILFMGGDARLSLDSEDFLTAGVEIQAKPPSKSLKSISLLSGGEKALTAVALLFAIFEQNPAPFSILDEIDAALDESNIKRYIDYLKGLSDKTQFIIITHRQTTMQLADKIHGVTIGDDGISKLYSLAFD